MLTCLRIRNLAIIEEIELELGTGMVVFTGETGAGKSILVDALQLVLGARATSDAVRTGAERAEIEALFTLSPSEATSERLRACGVEASSGEEVELVVWRTVLASGRSRAYVNGQLVPVKSLAALAAGLVDISSQHQHHSLVNPGTHLDYLDGFAGLEVHRTAVERAHRRLSDADRALAAARGRSRDRVEREDLLRFQVGELEALELVEGETRALEEERGRLRHAGDLAEIASTAERRLVMQDGAVCAVLGRLGADLEHAVRLDATLEPLAASLEEARVLIEEASRELGSYARGLEADPNRMAQVEERLHRVRRMVGRYGGTEQALLEWARRAREELDELAGGEEVLERLVRERADALEVAEGAAVELSRRRREGAVRLGAAITRELSSLGMGGATVHVEVTPLDGRGGELEVAGGRLTPTGCDRVELMIAPNPGETPRPLGQIASGGELSRSLLAIKRVLAERGPVGSYVFDEVDSGVGGAVAEVIGRKLEDVARHHQVLCITHLPQIAARGDVHLKVRKEVVGERTFSRVMRLTRAERVEELARMLGGIAMTDATRELAEEMLRGETGEPESVGG